MRAVAVLVCRLDSTRLYAKPMQLVGEQPIIRHLLDRLEKVAALDQIILAIADTPAQHVLIDVAKKNGLDYVVASMEDVLLRICKGAQYANADIVIRVGTENPFPYWENLSELIERHKASDASLTLTTGLPLGCHIEVISFEALKYQLDNNVDPIYHQHLVSYLSEHPELFKIDKVPCPPEIKRPDIRLTVDYPEDLIFVRKLHEALHQDGKLIRVADIVKHLEDHPELMDINKEFAAPNYVWA